MKVVIIEGPDNVGKTTVIDQLIHRFDNVYYMHFQKPTATDSIYAALEQKKVFINAVNKIESLSQIKTDIVILDRSWLGEYVYGCKYRNNGEEFVLNMINECYGILHEKNITCYTVLLNAYTPDFCLKHEDGNSLSNSDKDNIKDEINRFNSLYDIYKNINEAHMSRIIVNDRLEFRSKRDIFNEVLTAIGEEQC